MVARWIITVLVVAVSCAPQISRREQGPAIALDKDLWEFGNLKRGETVSTQLTVTNKGSDTLHISVFSTCDCLVASPVAEAVVPQAEIPIMLYYTGENIKDRATKTLFIDSDDRSNPRVSVEVTGRVLPGDLPHMVALPDPLLFDKSESADHDRILTVSNRGRQNLLIKEVRCFGCVSEWTETALSGGEEAQLGIGLLPDWQGSRWIEIESNDPVWPVRRVVIVELM